MMPIPSQYSDIVSRMLKATKEGRVRWNEGSTESHFFVAFAKSTLVLWEGVDAFSGQEFVSVGIRNEKGNLADSFHVDKGDHHYDTLEMLYALARRSARRIDDAIVEITKELQREGHIGAEVDTESESQNDDLPF